MKHVYGALVIGFIGVCIGTNADAQGSLKGAWTITEVTYIGLETSFTNTNPNPSLFLFTDRHYSMVHVLGTEPQPYLSDNAEYSDEQIVAAFNAFVANSGTYETSGDTLIYNVQVAKVSGFAGTMQEATYSVQGDTLIHSETYENGLTVRMTLRRLE